ncbi:MAG: VanZ family protein [Chitinophagaceae bacterium]|nr:VanZ family protein [Chitinophagaceae bacterium]
MKILPIKFVPAFIWLCISFWLLTLPGSSIPHEDWFDTFQVDKWVHIFLFSILGLLFMYPFKKSSVDHTSRLPWFLLITISTIAYGIVMEFVQRDFIPNRSFDIWDIAADSIGSFIAFGWCNKKYRGI